MVLLDMFKQNDVCVVHVNHNTRGDENIREMNLVKEVCMENDIDLYCFDYEFDGKGNFHKSSREFRYSKFLEVSKIYGLSEVYLAHHFDDQIENILMNPQKIGRKIMRETENIFGLKVKRPLLNKSKQDVYNYAKINNIRYMEDTSNSDVKYYRNRIRKKLEQYTYEEKVKLYENELKRSLEIDDLIYALKSRSTFLISNETVDNKFIYCFLKSRGYDFNISTKKIQLILDFLKTGNNGEIHLSNEYVFVNSYGTCFVRSRLKSKIHRKVKCKSGEVLDFNGIIYTCKVSGFTKVYETGDKIPLKSGSKKVSRFFIDQKIPKHLRKKWPININENGEIMFIPKYNEVKFSKEINEQ